MKPYWEIEKLPWIIEWAFDIDSMLKILNRMKFALVIILLSTLSCIPFACSTEEPLQIECAQEIDARLVGDWIGTIK